MTSVKSSTEPSMSISRALVVKRSVNVINRSNPPIANANPSAPPATVSNVLSVTS